MTDTQARVGRGKGKPAPDPTPEIDIYQLRADLAAVLDALDARIPQLAPVAVERQLPADDSPPFDERFWRDDRRRIRSGGVLTIRTITGDGAGYVYITGGDRLAYQTDYTCLPPNEARRIARALFAAAQDAENELTAGAR
jgi:hypothetical protein